MFRTRYPPPGSHPGTLAIDSHGLAPVIRLMEYTSDQLREQTLPSLAELPAQLPADAVTWIDVEGLGDEAVLRGLAERFNLHPLALADVVNVPQRPKADLYEHNLFVTLRMPRPENVEHIDSEQVSIFVGQNWVLTFQERYGNEFEPIRARLRSPGTLFRKSGAGYLAYALLDLIIDGYYPLLERLGEGLERLETTLLGRPRAGVIRRVQRARRELLAIRRSVWPLREAVGTLVRDDLPFIGAHVRVYLRDCYDHCVQLLDIVETYRELVSGLQDLYLSAAAQRQNEIMKVLTVMASIFIPLTFLAGVYGMNFDYMPELHRPWGYPLALGVMALIGLGMLGYFYRKGWLHADAPDSRDDTGRPR